MLMLEDVKNRPLLLRKLEQAVHSNQYFLIVSKGKAMSEGKIISTSEEVKSCIASFRVADLAIAGVSHGNIVSPLFALSRNIDESVVTLKEYLTFSDVAGDKGKTFLENELTALSVFISIFYPNIYKIRLPIKIDRFNNQECNIEYADDGYFLNIKKSMKY